MELFIQVRQHLTQTRPKLDQRVVVMGFEPAFSAHCHGVGNPDNQQV